MNFRRMLPMSRDVSNLTEYFDPESRLNCRIVERKSLPGGTAVIIETLCDANGTATGYDVCLCRKDKLPKSEDWGTTAWSWINYGKAKEQFDHLGLIEAAA